ncbi:hypothetical protein FBY34_8182 [Streptomyces sp. SLBN-115]|nr:hypothetical protein FBY34_8182 [Streptomyces sp. SLBN-115]
MLHNNGLDAEVRRYVMATPGARELVSQNAEKVRILLRADNLKQWAGRQRYRVDVHVVCAGGLLPQTTVAGISVTVSGCMFTR